MQVSVTDAKARLTDLIRRAEAGDEVILTRHGQPAVRLVPAASTLGSEELRAKRKVIMTKVIAEARKRGSDGGPAAARAADFLYGDDGLPA